MADGQLVVAERWPSANDLAGLPDMPATVQGVRIMADREAWEKRPRAKGKGWEFNPANLPAVTQRELRRRAAISAANSVASNAGMTVGRKLALTETIDKAAQQREREAGLARSVGLTGWKKSRMDARCELLDKYHQFAQNYPGGLLAAQEAFVAAYRAGDIYLPVETRCRIGCQLSVATLRRDLRKQATQGPAALAGNYGNRAGSGLIESQPALRDFVLGLIAEKPHVSAKNLHRVVAARFAGTDVAVPHERSCARWLATLKREHAQMYTAIANPDAWKSRYKPAFGSASEDVVRLNQRWELDSTPAEVMLVDGRHTIVQVCDIWSRRRLFYVAKTSSAAAVCEALRRAVLAWGIPESVKIDNGKDYVSERVQRAFRNLGAEVLISPPFQPWKKPHVERGFHTFLHGLFEMLPGYLGHDVAEAQAIRASKSFAERMFVKDAVVEMHLSADELQLFCDRWCAIHETEPTQGLNGLSPREQIARWTGEVRRITSERALDLLLAEAPEGNGGRTVTKKGLRVEGHTYIAPELAALVGERVQVFYDERDIGRMVVYHNEAFACVAECPEIAGISRAEIAAAATAITRQRIAEQRAAMRKLKGQIRKVDLVEAVLVHKEEQAQQLALPPVENVIDAQPQFAQAQRAAEALDVPAYYAPIAAVEAIGGTDDRAGRIAHALDALLAFDALDDAAKRKLKNYLAASEFGGFWTMFTDFGPADMRLDEKYAALLPEGSLAHHYPRALAFGDAHLKSA